MAQSLDGWKKEWQRDADDCQVLKPYLLPSEELVVPVVTGKPTVPQTRRVWVGPAVDCIRLDVMSLTATAVAGVTATVFMELRATAGTQPVGLLLCAGHWTIDPNNYTGFLVQCTGVISDGFELKLAVDGTSWTGGEIKLGFRALVVRMGGPVAVTRGLLLP